MKDEELPVVLRIERLKCHNDGGAGKAEPYMLVAFFRIDGHTVKLGDDLRFAGTATLSAQDTPTHGNLGVRKVGSGDTIEIPPRLVRFETTLRLIAIPPGVPHKGLLGVSGVVGFVYVLLEFDTAKDTAANSAHRDFNQALRSALNSTVSSATIGEGGQLELDDRLLKRFEETLKQRLGTAIVKAQGPVANLISVLNGDDLLGSKSCLLTHRELLDKPVQRFVETFDRHGKWEVTASIRALTPE